MTNVFSSWTVPVISKVIRTSTGELEQERGEEEGRGSIRRVLVSGESKEEDKPASKHARSLKVRIIICTV